MPSKNRWDAIRLEYADLGVYEVYQRGRFLGHIYREPWDQYAVPVRPGSARLEGYARRLLEWMFEEPGYTSPGDSGALQKAGFEVEVREA